MAGNWRKVIETFRLKNGKVVSLPTAFNCDYDLKIGYQGRVMLASLDDHSKMHQKIDVMCGLDLVKAK